MPGKGLLIVMAKISPEKEEAFNRWYNEVHLPMVLERVPGVLSGRRYKIQEERTLTEGANFKIDTAYQYMAIYEFENFEVMQNPLHSSKLAGLIREYNEPFGEGGRHHIRAVEIKSLIVG